MTTLLTPEAYRHYLSLWTPPTPPANGLLLIRHPKLDSIPLTTYLDLMQARIEGLIQDWLEQSGDSQAQVQTLLRRHLQQLSTQEPPSVEEDRWSWTMAWGETFAQQEVLFQALKQQSGSLSFPMPVLPTTPAEQTLLQQLHDEMTLEEWLSALTQEVS